MSYWYDFIGSPTSSGIFDTSTTDSQLTGTITTTNWFLDPLIDWLPYKYEKYIPTWHLVRSYKNG